MLAVIHTLQNERDEYQRLYLDYKRRWNIEEGKVEKLQDQLKDVPSNTVLTVAAVLSFVTVLWLLTV